MPTYEYRCQSCQHEFEQFQSIIAPSTRKCPKCGKLKVVRKIGLGGGVLFRGSGFYETDYRSEAYKQDSKTNSDLAKQETPPSASSASNPSSATIASKGEAAASGSKPESNKSEQTASKSAPDSRPESNSKSRDLPPQTSNSNRQKADREQPEHGQKSSPPKQVRDGRGAGNVRQLGRIAAGGAKPVSKSRTQSSSGKRKRK
ncbi:MAG: zinc ribbon domain-containing protein [Phycisphaerales bacterium]|nr:zinc ribbon domain-containing protein [Phycisphaerales bacterium]